MSKKANPSKPNPPELADIFDKDHARDMAETSVIDLNSTPKKQSLLKSSALMASGTLFSRILGFIKSALLVAAIGVSAGVADSFQLANTLPQTVYNLLAAGMLDAILIPQIVRALKQKSGQIYVNRLLTLSGTILFLMTVVALIAAPLLVIINAGSFTPEMRMLAITFSLWCLPQIFFYGLYNLLGELLNARGVFGPYMWAPVINNVIAIVGLVAFISMWGSSGEIREIETFTTIQVVVLAGSSTLGVIVQALFLLIPMRRSNVKFSLDFHFKGTSFKAASKVAGWTFATLMVSQVGVLSTNNLATRASSWTEVTGEVVASLQAYNYGFMVYMVPQSLISLTLATAIFTRISHHVADRQWRKVAEDYEGGIRMITMLSFLAAAVIIATAQPIMQIILPSFDAHSASMYGNILAALIPAVASTGIIMLSQRMFFAFENAKPVFLMGIVPTILQVIVGWTLFFVLEPQFWTIGASIAETICRITQGFIALLWTARLVHTINAGRLVVWYIRYLIAFAISAGIGWLVLHFLGAASLQETTSGRFVDALWKFGVTAFIVVAVYCFLLSRIDPETVSTVSGVLSKRFGRSDKAASVRAEARVNVEETRMYGDAEQLTSPGDETGLQTITQQMALSAHLRRKLDIPTSSREDTTVPGRVSISKRLQSKSMNTGANSLGQYSSGQPTGIDSFGSSGQSISPTGERAGNAAASRFSLPGFADSDSDDSFSSRFADSYIDDFTDKSAQSTHSNHDDEDSFDPTKPMMVFAILLLLAGLLFAVLNLMPMFGAMESDSQDQGTSQNTSSQTTSDASDPDTSTGSATSEEEVNTTSSVQPTISSISVFSWNDDGGDHPELVENLFDGDTSTQWYSRYYNVNQFQDSTMIGLLIDLESESEISSLTFDIAGAGGEAQIRINTDGDARGGEVVYTFEFTDSQTVVNLPEAINTQQFAITFVTLPTDDEGLNRAKISEITVE